MKTVKYSKKQLFTRRSKRTKCTKRSKRTKLTRCTKHTKRTRQIGGSGGPIDPAAAFAKAVKQTQAAPPSIYGNDPEDAKANVYVDPDLLRFYKTRAGSLPKNLNLRPIVDSTINYDPKTKYFNSSYLRRSRTGSQQSQQSYLPPNLLYETTAADYIKEEPVYERVGLGSIKNHPLPEIPINSSGRNSSRRISSRINHTYNEIGEDSKLVKEITAAKAATDATDASSGASSATPGLMRSGAIRKGSTSGVPLVPLKRSGSSGSSGSSSSIKSSGSSGSSTSGLRRPSLNNSDLFSARKAFRGKPELAAPPRSPRSHKHF